VKEMPCSVAHLNAANMFWKELGTVSEEIAPQVQYYFMMGQIVPDLVSWTATSKKHTDLRHFRNPNLWGSRFSDGCIIVPDLQFANKYFREKIKKRKTLEEKAYLAGINFHIWLDEVFFTKFLYKIFYFRSGNVFSQDYPTFRRTTAEFTSKGPNGIYNAYDCFSALFIGRVKGILDSLPVKLPKTNLAQYDNGQSDRDWKADIYKFAASANFSETAIPMDYDDMFWFITKQARMLALKHSEAFVRAMSAH